MRHLKLLSVVAAVTLAAAAHAATVTREAKNHAVGSDVTTAYSGVTLSRQNYVAGGALQIHPLTIEQCTTFGICEITMAPLNTFGGQHWDLFNYRDCYNGLLVGYVSWQCGNSHSVLSIEFTTPTDFVELTATWTADAPALIAYDSAGNQLSQCTEPASCLSSVLFEAYVYSGTIRATSSSSSIKRVIFASPSGGSRVTGMQYNTRSRWCLAAAADFPR
jgi:hypothetical protein